MRLIAQHRAMERVPEVADHRTVLVAAVEAIDADPAAGHLDLTEAVLLLNRDIRDTRADL